MQPRRVLLLAGLLISIVCPGGAAALAGLLLAAAPAYPEKAGNDAAELGRQYTAWFYAGEADRLWERFSPEMKQALGSAGALRGFREQVAAQVGTEEEVLSEEVAAVPPYRVYVRKVKMSKAPMAVVVQWTLDQAGGIAGFFVRPGEAAPSKHLDYQTKAPLRLPFEGEWHVVWGGRTIDDNYHVVAADQRFAYDFLVVEGGSSFKGDGKANEQYHCFGKPILAPAAGTVAAVADGIEDNRPGEMNALQPPGNHVVLDHGNNEFSFLAHLKKGSVAVKVGDRVEAGARLGVCGNSGNSSEPHLHYHLQSTPRFGAGEGLPAFFNGYVADGKPVERGEPRKGQVVRPR
jgi:hypothetical protein